MMTATKQKLSRRQVLEDFQHDLEKVSDFLGEYGLDAPIALIDPMYDPKWHAFARHVQERLDWLRAEIGNIKHQAKS